MGVSDLFAIETVWSLTSLDDSRVIEGQFRPSNLTENVSGNWDSQATVGMDHPILQFVNGAQETITFDAKIWAKHNGVFGTGLEADNIKDIVDTIRDMPRKDADLGRPHVWEFVWTEEFSQTVVVTSVGGIRYDHARPEAYAGLIQSSLRGVLFRITLSRYVEHNARELIGAAESLIIYVKEGEQYDAIAYRLYGDARLGEVLRRRNPSKRVLVAGERLHIPPKSTALAELDLRLEALPLIKRKAAQSALFDAVLSKRSVDYRSHIIHGDL